MGAAHPTSVGDLDEPGATLALLDWRRRVAELYAEVRAAGGGQSAWEPWRAGRDALFATHPQSPIPPAQRRAFTGLPTFAYDPAWCVRGVVETSGGGREVVGHSGDGGSTVLRWATVRFEVRGQEHALPLLWFDAYGGGLFLPFRDATNGTSTYGGGRYLLDTIKGADLGQDSDRLVLDFNFAYHPSCVHDPRWSCPLAPPDAHLPVTVEAGERLAPRTVTAG